MEDYVAAALARRLKRETDPACVAGIRAAMVVGGFDPDTGSDEPEGYIEVAVSDARAWSPACLSMPELAASLAASERVIGGPF